MTPEKPTSQERVIVEGRPGREQYGNRYWIVDRPGGGYDCSSR